MKGTAYIILPTHNDISEAEIRNYSKPMPLAEMQDIVQGYIELVPGFKTCRPLLKSDQKCAVFCNEEGLILNLAANPVATRLWREAAPYMRDQYLCGPIMFVTGNEKFMASL